MEEINQGGWLNVRIGDVLGIFRGGSPRPIKSYLTSNEDGINWIKIGDTKEGGKFIDSTLEKIKPEGLKKTRVVEPGDLLLSNSMSFGRPYIVRISGAIHDGWLVIKNSKKLPIEKTFLYYLFSSPHVFSQFSSLATGSTVKNLNIGLVSKVTIPLPPLPEQRAIVAKLEQLFSELEDGVANLQKAQQQLKVYRQAVLKKAFEGELTREWRAQQTDLPTAEELLAQIQAERECYYEQQLTEWKQAVADWEAEGKVGKKPRKPILKAEVETLTKEELELLSSLPKAWRWSKLINVTECLDRFRVPINKKQRAMRKGDIPYYGANGQVGWIDDYIFDEELVIVVEDETFTGREIPFSYKISGKSWVNNHAHVLKGLPGLLNMDYLNYGLMYYPFIPLTTGTTGRKKLTQKALMNAPFQVCSLPEQHQIVQEIESRLSVCDQLEQDIEANLKRSERLRQSLLQKAFAGELLTEAELEACRAEPDWEPAEKLLERIKGAVR